MHAIILSLWPRLGPISCDELPLNKITFLQRLQSRPAWDRKLYGAFAAFAAVGACCLVAVTLQMVLLPALIARFPRADVSSHTPSLIIVLGGGEKRLAEAADLAARFPAAHLVVSGAGEEAVPYFFAERRMPRDRVVLEEKARNTYENAVFSAGLVGGKAAKRWLLVTSAYHMPRAVGAFRKAGFCIDPWPVYDLNPHQSSSLAIALREGLALLAYRIRGMTDALFPSPDTSPDKGGCI